MNDRLPIAHQTDHADCRLPIADFNLSIAIARLSLFDCRWPDVFAIADCPLPIAD
jgi:hypothetical protein